MSKLSDKKKEIINRFSDLASKDNYVDAIHLVIDDHAYDFFSKEDRTKIYDFLKSSEIEKDVNQDDMQVLYYTSKKGEKDISTDWHYILKQVGERLVFLYDMFPLRYKFQTEEKVYARIVNSNFSYLENNSKLSNKVIKEIIGYGSDEMWPDILVRILGNSIGKNIDKENYTNILELATQKSEEYWYCHPVFSFFANDSKESKEVYIDALKNNIDLISEYAKEKLFLSFLHSGHLDLVNLMIDFGLKRVTKAIATVISLFNANEELLGIIPLLVSKNKRKFSDSLIEKARIEIERMHNAIKYNKSIISAYNSPKEIIEDNQNQIRIRTMYIKDLESILDYNEGKQ